MKSGFVGSRNKDGNRGVSYMISIILLIVLIIFVTYGAKRLRILWEKGSNYTGKIAECPATAVIYLTMDSCEQQCSDCPNHLCREVDSEWRCIKNCIQASGPCKEKGDMCCIECLQGYEQVAECPEGRVCCKKI